VLEDDRVVVTGKLRLSALALNSRYISKKVDLHDTSGQVVGRLFVDLGLETQEKDRLPLLSQQAKGQSKKYWKS
jgi:hypothetical protein